MVHDRTCSSDNRMVRSSRTYTRVTSATIRTCPRDRDHTDFGMRVNTINVPPPPHTRVWTLPFNRKSFLISLILTARETLMHVVMRTKWNLSIIVQSPSMIIAIKCGFVFLLSAYFSIYIVWPYYRLWALIHVTHPVIATLLGMIMLSFIFIFSCTRYPITDVRSTRNAFNSRGNLSLTVWWSICAHKMYFVKWLPIKVFLHKLLECGIIWNLVRNQSAWFQSFLLK